MKNYFGRSFFAKLTSICLICLFIVGLSVAAGCNLKEPDDNADPTNAPADATEASPTEESGGTTVKTEGNPVVISSPQLDYTLYDFRQSYYANQYYMYMMYGMISPADYFDMVVDDASTFLYVYNAAVDNGVKLDDEELAALNTDFDTQIEGIISQYANDVDESVTDEAERRAKAIELLNNDLEQDGLDYDTFMYLAKHNLTMYKLSDKYYGMLLDEVEVSDSEVLDYINEQLASSGEMTTSAFKDAYEAYSYEQGAFPVFVPDDCFSVDHIFIQFETEFDDTGSTVYLKDSRKDTEAEIESKLASAADFAAFMELEVEYGEDPGMDEEAIRENGYIIHGDYDSMYFEGFVYAAMNLYNEGWTPTPNAETGETYELPELKYFTLKDGTKIVKVATEPGIHYMIINKTFKKGPVEYEIGDAHWLSWKDAVAQTKFTEQFDALREEWKTKYPVTVHTDLFRAEFVPSEDNASDGNNEG